MGGQACVFYGAAEFSRDTDFAILADAANLVRLRSALADLQADVVAVPPFELKYLRRGHAIHFRCQYPEVPRMRVHVMSVMSGRSGIVSRRPSAGWRARSCGRSICGGRDHLIRNPIRKVLSSMQARRVRALLMGGQACVFYGAAEFSRDTDLVILWTS